MEYLVATFGLVILCGCALGAYVALDDIERDEEGNRIGAPGRAHRSDRAGTTLPRGATLRPPVQFAHPPSIQAALEHRGNWKIVAAHADRLDGRVRSLEVQLDQLALRVRAVRVG